jgi:two-component sensor histidine kinase
MRGNPVRDDAGDGPERAAWRAAQGRRMSHRLTQRPRVTLAIAVACSTAVAVLFASQLYVYHLAIGRPVGLLHLLSEELVVWYFWAALSPAIFAIARRLPAEGPQRWRGIALQLPASALFAGLHVTLLSVADRVLAAPDGGAFFHGLFRDSLVNAFAADVLIYGLIVAVYYAVDNYRRFRERELRSAQLEAQLARTELQMVGMRLHPHFLFNTIHAVSALMHRDVEAADRMMTALADLLRAVPRNTEAQEVPLAEELRVLGLYVDVMQIRYGGRLRVVMDIEPDTEQALVPSLVLQPLVENAIQHGVAARGAGRIEVSARRLDSSLRMSVRDDGPGLPNGAVPNEHEGIGLSSTRARLRQLYGAAQRFELANHEAGGVEATLSLPFRVRLAGMAAGIASGNGEGEGDDTGLDRRRRAAGA